MNEIHMVLHCDVDLIDEHRIHSIVALLHLLNHDFYGKRGRKLLRATPTAVIERNRDTTGLSVAGLYGAHLALMIP